MYENQRHFLVLFHFKMPTYLTENRNLFQILNPTAYTSHLKQSTSISSPAVLSSSLLSMSVSKFRDKGTEGINDNHVESSMRSNGKRSIDMDTVGYKKLKLSKSSSLSNSQYDLIMKLWHSNSKRKTKLKRSDPHSQKTDDVRSLHETEKTDIRRKSHRKVPNRKSKNSWSWKSHRVERNVGTAYSYSRNDSQSVTVTADVSQESAYDQCLHPEYLVYTWVLSLIALASTLKLYFLIKTVLAVTMVAVYSLFILVFYPEVFSNVHSHDQ